MIQTKSQNTSYDEYYCGPNLDQKSTYSIFKDLRNLCTDHGMRTTVLSSFMMSISLLSLRGNLQYWPLLFKFLEWIKVEKLSAVGLEFFNITFEFIEKHLNTSVFQHGNNNSYEKTKK